MMKLSHQEIFTIIKNSVLDGVWNLYTDEQNVKLIGDNEIISQLERYSKEKRLNVLYFTGQCSNNNSLTKPVNIHLIYVLVGPNSRSERQKRIREVVSILTSYELIPVVFIQETKIRKSLDLIQGKFTIRIKDENDNEITVSSKDIGLKSEGVRKFIKISSISQQCYDETGENLYIVNSKQIRDVIFSNNVSIASKQSSQLSFESLFQTSLELTYPLINEDFEFELKNGNFVILKEQLREFVNAILEKSKNKSPNIKTIHLKHSEDTEEILYMIKSFIDYMDSVYSSDEIVLDLENDIMEVIQNLLTAYSTWKRILNYEGNIKTNLYVVSEKFYSDVINKIKGRESLLKDIIVSLITSDYDKVQELVSEVKITEPKLNNIQKLYFLLSSINKDTISSGDLYIIVEREDNRKLSDFVKSNPNLGKNSNSEKFTKKFTFDFTFNSQIGIYPISYKKLSGQRYGKFTLEDITKIVEKSKLKDIEKILSSTNQEIQDILNHMTTISERTVLEFVKQINKLELPDFNVEELILKENVKSKLISNFEPIVTKLLDFDTTNVITLSLKKLTSRVFNVLNSQQDGNKNPNKLKFEEIYNEVLNEIKKSDPTMAKIESIFTDVILNLLTIILILEKIIPYSEYITEQITRYKLNERLQQINDILKKTKGLIKRVKKYKKLSSKSEILQILEVVKTIFEILQKKIVSYKNVLLESLKSSQNIDGEHQKLLYEFKNNVFNSLISILNQYIFLLSFEDISNVLKTILKIVNKQLKLKVNLKINLPNEDKMEEVTFEFKNSYFITSDVNHLSIPFEFDSNTITLLDFENSSETENITTYDIYMNIKQNIVSLIQIELEITENGIKIKKSDFNESKFDKLFERFSEILQVYNESKKYEQKSEEYTEAIKKLDNLVDISNIMTVTTTFDIEAQYSVQISERKVQSRVQIELEFRTFSDKKRLGSFFTEMTKFHFKTDKIE